MAGGGSWATKWLKFDNEYYNRTEDSDLVWLPTDQCLKTDPSFSTFFDLYATDIAAFFSDYAKAHKKLSELGSVFEPAEGIKI